MATDPMNDKLQEVTDMLHSAVEQRNAAENTNLQLAAQVRARDRRIADLEKQLQEAKTPTAEAIPVTRANGHDAEAHAA